VNTWTAIAIVLTTLGADPAGDASSKGASPKAKGEVSTSAKTTAPEKGASAKPAPAEYRDLVLFLDKAPMHFRVHIRLASKPIDVARNDLAERWLKQYDANLDGKLSREEMQKMPALRQAITASGAKFLDSLKGGGGFIDLKQKIAQMGGEAVAIREQKDAANSDSDVFKFLDADGNGELDSKEMDAAIDRVGEKDNDRDECISFEEFMPPPPPVAMPINVIGMDQPPRPSFAPAELIRDASEPLLPKRLIKKYDRNRDSKLNATEIGWQPDRFATLDVNRDNKLDENELRRFGTSAVDLELNVDLAANDQQGSGKLEALNVVGDRLDDGKRGNFAKVSFADAIVTFSERDLDPIAEANRAALAEFNALDADGNGYLDRDETRDRVRLENGLFQQMDVDGDNKVFAQELKDYVANRAEPLSNSCRVQVFDTGYGFFMTLDANGDGRISTREIRKADQSLKRLDRDEKTGVTANEPKRHFHVEFSRGVFKLGPVNDPMQNSGTPSFQSRNLTGPVWFQRMDRNGDGDLSWNEFLGPRDVFQKLDKDHDELIDPVEAEAAAGLSRSAT
jgi:Ca2+-binding EF-hand superfamily protein